MVWNNSTSKCDCSNTNTSMVYVKDCTAELTTVNAYSCVTYDKESHATLVGFCPFNSHDIDMYSRMSFKVPAKNINLTSYMCNPLNRTGVLCGCCKPGLGPALLNYSHPCLECTIYGWVVYFAATLIPATVFFTFSKLMPHLPLLATLSSSVNYLFYLFK